MNFGFKSQNNPSQNSAKDAFQDIFSDDSQGKPIQRSQPLKGSDAEFYKPIGKKVEQSPQPEFVQGWNIYEDFLEEMNEFPQELLNKWILAAKTEVKNVLENSKEVGYSSQDGRYIYSMLFGRLLRLSYIYSKKSPMRFGIRCEVDFGCTDPENDEDSFEIGDPDYAPPEEEKTTTDQNEVVVTKAKHNLVLNFGDIDAPSKSFFTDIYSGFTIKFMDQDCEYDRQVFILSTILQILSLAESQNVYYGLLVNENSRTFFKYNQSEGILYQSGPFVMNMDELYMKGYWTEDEERFYLLLAAICLKFMKYSAH
jgi:hypothetical protein